MKGVAIAVTVLMIHGQGLAAPIKRRDPDQIGRRSVGGGVNLYSRKSEIAMGRDLAHDVERRVRVIEDPVVSEYVSRIGQNLVNNSDARYSFIIKVIRSDEINAFALPGGFLFINSGLIRAADNEAELASAMAHEIAHVAARHYTRQASWEQIISFASIPLVFIGGWPGVAIQQGAAIATPLAFKKLSRDAEAEADMLGIQYLYKTGYDPAAFVDFFERMTQQEKSKPGVIVGMLAVHPALLSRIRAVQKQIQRDLSPQPQYLIQTSEFQLVKERLIAIENGKRVPSKNTRPSSSDERPVLRRHD
jgi:predicted Zn-dependent protease